MSSRQRMCLDPADFIPCPHRPGHWMKVLRIPRSRIDHGRGHFEIVPARVVEVGFIVICKTGQTITDRLDEMAREDPLDFTRPAPAE